jgi:choline dehydrogenase
MSVSTTDGDRFDYVIVGAGSAGAVLANRLTASGRYRVLLLEAGPRDTNPWIHIPLGYGKHFKNQAINWMYSTAPNPEQVDRPVYQPRGKVLGGSSSINGLVYIRGHREDYNQWRQLGNVGWSYEDVLPYFIRSEDQERGADDYHGVGGPLAVSDAYEKHPLAEAFIEAAVECGYPETPDFNGAEQEGFGRTQWTIRNGRRCSVAVGYLKPIRGRANLRIETEAHALRVLFEGRRATGVEYEQRGETKVAHADGEVLVCGGAYNSPQLLQLSGVGPAELLRKHGISVVADTPGVGANLRDHVNGPLMFRLNRPGFSANQVVNSFTQRMLTGARYALTRKGFLAMGVSFGCGFATIDPAAASPDVQIQLMMFSSHEVGGPPHPFPGATIVVALMRPESYGHVHIVSPDPYAAPEIQPNYLTAQKDRDVLIGGLKAARKISQRPVFQQYLVEEHEPGPGIASDDEWLDYLRRRARTSFHPVSTCRMGTDDGAVVDPRLRVRGFEGLRVVDASIMPTLVSGNTNAPTIMIGEKASDMILEDAA